MIIFKTQSFLCIFDTHINFSIVESQEYKWLIQDNIHTYIRKLYHSRGITFRNLMVFLLFKKGRNVLFMEWCHSNQWSEFLLLLLNHVRMLKMIFELCCSLDPCVAYMADLSWIKPGPSAKMKFSIKICNKLGADKVEKSIPDVAAILNIKILTL